jgi:hypothetical protein
MMMLTKVEVVVIIPSFGCGILNLTVSPTQPHEMSRLSLAELGQPRTLSNGDFTRWDVSSHGVRDIGF